MPERSNHTAILPLPLSIPHTRKSAFTLVELSIVLVILGLLIGGVLSGQSLIRAAQLRGQLRQFQDYQTAINTFRLKYDCLPGDCDMATRRFGTTGVYGHTVYNGNNNGRIDTSDGKCYDDMSPCGGTRWGDSYEMNSVFQHLALAGLITFNPTNPTGNGPPGVSLPANVLNPATGFFLGAAYNFTVPTGIHAREPETNNMVKSNNWIWMVACNNLSGTDTLGTWDNQCGIFNPQEMYNMDQKADDGKPLTGRVIGFGGGGPSANTNCLNAGFTDYDLTQKSNQCQGAYEIN